MNAGCEVKKMTFGNALPQAGISRAYREGS